MDKKYRIKFFPVMLLVSAICVINGFATSVEIPGPMDARINDFANIVVETRKDQIKEILSQVEQQTGVEITLVTVPSVKEYLDKASQVDSLAKSFFNRWGVGDKVLNNGVLILISVKERVLRFEFGSEYNPRVLVHLDEILKDKILPFFTRGNYSDGAFASTMYAIQEVTTPVGFFEYYRAAIVLGFLALVSFGFCWNAYSNEKSGVVFGTFLMTGFFVFFLCKDIRRNSHSVDFGGGGAAGVGLTARWPAN